MEGKLEFDEIWNDIKRLMDDMMVMVMVMVMVKVMVKDLARCKVLNPDELLAQLGQLNKNSDGPTYVADQFYTSKDADSSSAIAVANPIYNDLLEVNKSIDSEEIRGNECEIGQKSPLTLEGPGAAHNLFDKMPSSPSKSQKEGNDNNEDGVFPVVCLSQAMGSEVDIKAAESINSSSKTKLGNAYIVSDEELAQALSSQLTHLDVNGELLTPLENGDQRFGGGSDECGFTDVFWKARRDLEVVFCQNGLENETFKLFDKIPISASDIKTPFLASAQTMELMKSKCKNHTLLIDNDVAFYFNPGGCTLSQMDCDPFEFIGEQRDFYSVTNVVEFIAFTDMIKDASNCDDLVQNHGTDEDIFEYEGFLRHGQASLVLVDCPGTIERTGTWQTNYGVSDCFVNYLCVTHALKGGSAFLSNKGVLVPTSISTLGNSVLASFHNMDKTSGAIMILGLFKILEGVLVEWFLFIHPKDVRFTSLNISIGWEVACEEVEIVFTWKSHFIFNLGVPLDDLSWKIITTIVVASLVIHVVSRISFTDRSLRNSRLMLVVAQLVEPIAFELGKSPIVVFEDDDTDNAIDWTIFNFFLTIGRIHCATFHLFINVRIAKRFFGRFMIWCQDVGEYLTLEKLSNEMLAGIKKVGWISMIYEDELWGVDLYRVEKNNKMEETKLQECNHTALAKSTSQLQTGLPGSIYIHAASVFHQKPLAIFWTDYVSFRRCHTHILCRSLLSEYTLACLGDTCFSNAVMLCLTYAEPLFLGLFYWRNHRFGRLCVRCALYESVEISLRFIVEVVTPQILRGGLSLSTLPCCKCDLFSQFSVKYELPIDVRWKCKRSQKGACTQNWGMPSCRFVCVKKVLGNFTISALSVAHSFDASQINISTVVSRLNLRRGAIHVMCFDKKQSIRWHTLLQSIQNVRLVSLLWDTPCPILSVAPHMLLEVYQLVKWEDDCGKAPRQLQAQELVDRHARMNLITCGDEKELMNQEPLKVDSMTYYYVDSNSSSQNMSHHFIDINFSTFIRKTSFWEYTIPNHFLNDVDVVGIFLGSMKDRYADDKEQEDIHDNIFGVVSPNVTLLTSAEDIGIGMRLLVDAIVTSISMVDAKMESFVWDPGLYMPRIFSILEDKDDLKGRDLSGTKLFALCFYLKSYLSVFPLINVIMTSVTT